MYLSNIKKWVWGLNTIICSYWLISKSKNEVNNVFMSWLRCQKQTLCTMSHKLNLTTYNKKSRKHISVILTIWYLKIFRLYTNFEIVMIWFKHSMKITLWWAHFHFTLLFMLFWFIYFLFIVYEDIKVWQNNRVYCTQSLFCMWRLNWYDYSLTNCMFLLLYMIILEVTWLIL